MMGSYVCDLPSLTIASGGTTSNAIAGLDDADVIVVYAPTALTGTITVQIEPTATGSNFIDLQSGGTDVTVGASNSVTIGDIGFRQLRVSSSVAEGATRVFTVTKQFMVTR